MDGEYDILGGYLPSFVEHLNDTRARLGLGTGSTSDTHDTLEDVSTPFNWTAAEHNAFFRALSVHSRWRPDLIAACIPTRPAWEVWMYLEMLDEGAAALDAQQASDDVEMEGPRDERLDAPSDPETDDEAWGWCEPALEVSQAWIDVEEQMAAWIVQQEGLTSVEEDMDADTEDVGQESRKRTHGRSRGSKQGRARSRVRGRTVSSDSRFSQAVDEDHRSVSPGLLAVSADRLSVSPTRTREALMGCLDSAHLLVLDSILREGEGRTKEKGEGREDSETMPTPHADQGEHQVDALYLSNRTSTTQETSNVSCSSNVAIDPELLALSGDADPPGESTSKEDTTESLSNTTSLQIPLEVSSQPGASNTFVSPLGNPDPPESSGQDLSLLSPRERRRIQKRLYMRRKRAMDREEGAVDTRVQKLKPGKKSKVDRSVTPAVSQSVPDSEGPSSDEEEPAKKVRKNNKGGVTLPYKLKARFGELGIDAAYLRSQGMDLLNLGALGRLMGLRASLELEEESDIGQSIDAQLIRHLQGAVVSFVTDIIHRAIVWKEREIRLKQRCQAWRQGDQITISAIEHAVEAVGARYHSHKEYFKALEVFHGRRGEPSNAPVNETEPSPADPGVEAADLPAVFSPHRETYTPLIRPPATWRTSPLACLSRTYEREATRTRRGPSAEAEEELMSDTTDTEGLAGELGEEAEREAEERAEGEREEGRLWEIRYKI